MDVRQLYYFLALSQQQHMSNTADFLGISQPALSKNIANLEKEAGTQLFDRYGNTIQLNEYGSHFATYVQKALRELETGLSVLRQARYDTCGEIRIACFAFADSLSECILSYTQLNPKISINMSQVSPKKGALLPEMDFALLSGKDEFILHDQPHTWDTCKLFTEQRYLLISPRYRVYPPEVTSLKLADLKEDLFIEYPVSSPLFSDATYRFCSFLGFTPKIFCTTDSYMVKMRFVDAGKAICILPECNLPMARRISPDIRTFSIEDVDTSRTLYLACRQNALSSEAAADFWEFVKDFFGDEKKNESL